MNRKLYSNRFQKITLSLFLSCFLIISFPNYAFADSSSCKILNSSYIHQPHNIGFPRPEGRIKNSGNINYKVLFVKFADSKNLSKKDSKKLLSKINPVFINKYYKNLSDGRVNINLVADLQWITLEDDSSRITSPSQDFDFFANSEELIKKVIDKADVNNDFSTTDGVMVVLDPVKTFLNYSYAFRINKIIDDTVISNAILFGSNIDYASAETIAVHEIGHNFGLGDLYDFEFKKDKVNFFSLMNGKGLATGLLGWEKYITGWLEDTQVICHQFGKITKILSPLEKKSGLKIIIIPLNPSQVVVIEHRNNAGLDEKLNSHGVIAYTVDTSIQIGSMPIKVLNNQKSIKLGKTIEYDRVKITNKSKSKKGYEVQIQVN